MTSRAHQEGPTPFGQRLRALFEGPTVAQGTFLQAPVEAVLELRAGPAFDSEFTRVEGVLFEACPENDETFREVEEAAYRAVHGRIAAGVLPAHVLDDVNLILRAHRAGYEDPWLSALLACYVAGRFPCGVLTRDARPLTEVLGVLEP